MSVSAIGGGIPQVEFSQSASAFRARMEQGMEPVAQLFGTTPDQLMSDVRASGGSLADYAASKGISKDALIAAIKQGLQANAPNGAQLSDTQLTNLANRIANHKPGDHSQGLRGGDNCNGVGQSSNSSQTKTDLEKLIDDLKSATSSSGTSSSTDSNGVNALVQMLTRFDQQL